MAKVENSQPSLFRPIGALLFGGVAVQSARHAIDPSRLLLKVYAQMYSARGTARYGALALQVKALRGVRNYVAITAVVVLVSTTASLCLFKSYFSGGHRDD